MTKSKYIKDTDNAILIPWQHSFLFSYCKGSFPHLNNNNILTYNLRKSNIYVDFTSKVKPQGFNFFQEHDILFREFAVGNKNIISLTFKSNSTNKNKFETLIKESNNPTIETRPEILISVKSEDFIGFFITNYEFIKIDCDTFNLNFNKSSLTIAYSKWSNNY